jgi:hypothetical protein
MRAVQVIQTPLDQKLTCLVWGSLGSRFYLTLKDPIFTTVNRTDPLHAISWLEKCVDTAVYVNYSLRSYNNFVLMHFCVKVPRSARTDLHTPANDKLQRHTPPVCC